MDWILIIVIGGFSGVSEVRSEFVTGDQCRESVRLLRSFKSYISAACVGPKGEAFTFDDVEK